MKTHFEEVAENTEGLFTDEQVEFAEFLSKMDWEGGAPGLIGYGGSSVFPESLQFLADTAERALDALQDAISARCDALSIKY